MPKSPELGSSRLGVVILQRLPSSLRAQVRFFQGPCMTSQPHPSTLSLPHLAPGTLVSLQPLPPTSHCLLYLLFLLLGIPFPLSYLLNTCSVSKIQLKYYVLPGNLLLTREGGNSILGSHFGPYVNFYLINLCISLYSSLQPQKLSSVWKSENH